MSRRLDIAISETEANLRLDHFLSGELPEHSRSSMQQWIKQGLLTVNGCACKPSRVLKTGDVIACAIPDEKPALLIAEDLPLRILYQDESILVVDKPSGMVVHPGAGVHGGTLVHALLHHAGNQLSHLDTPRPGIIHRLDKETSGLLLVARDDKSHDLLAGQFQSRQIEKMYYALVHGSTRREEEEIDAAIGRDRWNRTRMSLRSQKLRPALTRYRVQERFSDYTLLEVRIMTGRTHQIRVHLSAMGNPVAGDTTYGTRRHVRPEADRAIPLHRLFLHAALLSFHHPRTGQPMQFESPLPAELLSVLDHLRRLPPHGP